MSNELDQIFVHYTPYGLNKFRQGDRVYGSMDELEKAFPPSRYKLIAVAPKGTVAWLLMTEQATKKSGGPMRRTGSRKLKP